jgi:hypothetical protein
MQAVLAWLRRQIETVPPEIAVCEFRCRKPQCRVADWEVCSSRTAFGATNPIQLDPPARREA